MVEDDVRRRASRGLAAGALMGLFALVTGVIGPVATAGAAGKAPLTGRDGMRANAPASTGRASAASTEAAAKAAVAKAEAAARAASPPLTREQALADPALHYTDLRAERPAKAKVDALRATAVKEGAVRVLVTVAARYAPQGILTAAELKSQKSTIAALQQKVAAATKPKGAQIIYTYDANVPTIAMLATPAALDELRSDPSVARVEEDALSYPALEQSGPQVGAADAHDRGFTGSGWTVAVLDTGADSTHPFLRGATVEEACYSTACPGGGTSSTADGSAVPCTYAPLGCRHGTHVSGIAIGLATADRPLREGIANGGLLFSIQIYSQATGTPCDNADEDPCTVSRASDQIAALNRVFARRAAHNIAAVNISTGGATQTTNCDTDTRKAPIDNLRAAGIATVISSGNDGKANAVSVPGCISTAITVGAVDKSDVVPFFSNTATMVDVLAPGVSIESSVPGGGYAFFDGTSMAAPHVAGAFAVMKSRTPSQTVDTGEAFLESTGKPIVDQGITMPRINVLKAISQEVDTLTNDQMKNHRNPIPYDHRYQTLSTSNFWSGVAVRPPSTGDVDLNVYDFFDYTGLLAGSTASGSTIDFVVQDNNTGRRATDNTYPSVHQYTGTGRYSFEYDNPVQTLPAVSTISMGSSEIIEMRDSFQTAGVPTYYRVSVENAGEDPEVFLMESTAGNPSTYVQGRASAAASSTSHGVGSDEWFSYTSPASQFGGLVLLNKAGGGDYTVYKDSTAPTGTVTINNGAASTNSRTVSLQLSASDADTGISGMRVSTASAAALANRAVVELLADEDVDAARHGREQDGLGAVPEQRLPALGRLHRHDHPQRRDRSRRRDDRRGQHGHEGHQRSREPVDGLHQDDHGALGDAERHCGRSGRLHDGVGHGDVHAGADDQDRSGHDQGRHPRREQRERGRRVHEPDQCRHRRLRRSRVRGHHRRRSVTRDHAGNSDDARRSVGGDARGERAAHAVEGIGTHRDRALGDAEQHRGRAG